MALASIPKRKKIRTILIIILSRAVEQLNQSVSGSIEEILSNQVQTANAIMLTNENSWSGAYDVVWATIEAIGEAYGEGENDPSQAELELLSDDLATALSNAGL